MPGGHVQAQHRPEEPELRRPHGAVNSDVPRRHHRPRVLRGDPPSRRPSVARRAHAEYTEHHKYEIDDPEHDERRRDARRRGGFEIRHEMRRHWRRDHRPAAKSHDRQSGGHARAIGKPLDERRHRRDVSEAEPHSAEYTVAEQHEPEPVTRDAERGDLEPRTETNRCGKHRHARSDALEPRAEHRRRHTKKHDRRAEHPADRAQLPISRRRRRDADGVR